MTIESAADDIRSMRVRGAALIGKHAAKALGAFADSWDESTETLEAAAKTLMDARPTAVSLPNAVMFVVRRAKRTPTRAALKAAADEFVRRAEAALVDIGENGASLVPDGGIVITICNSQGALTPMFAARRLGRNFEAIALETRPWRQGLLTARQLSERGIVASFAVDSAMGLLLEDADLVLIGADSLAQNGDVVNKIGTSVLGTMAREKGVPVYCCAETFKIHPTARAGRDVPIEERESAEVVKPGELPASIRVRNPVFDVTSHALVTGYVTEIGVLKRDALMDAARKQWEIR